jgi:hypothetical protein
MGEATYGDGTQQRNAFQCVSCSKSYSHFSGLSRHRSNFHGKNAHPFACQYCNKVLKNKQTLDTHLIKHKP